MMSATEETMRVKVEMTVTEEVTYEFPVTVDAPVDVVDDTEALTEYLDLHDELWVDLLPITGGSHASLSVNERKVEAANRVPLDEA